MVKKLDEKTISQIAAGEVVERLASIVKELVENSMDAKADDIQVTVNEVQNGIVISVRDNGVGMSETDILKSIENHSTSKISNIDDLTSINTYGFRGEALASIASISEITIESKQESTNTGRKITFKDNKQILNEIISMNNGTNIIIGDIFHNVPARKKFLKSFNTEFLHISKQFINLCLSNPNISFELVKNNKTIYKVNKVDLIQKRIKQIMFKDIEESFIKVGYNSDIKINGYIEKPNIAGKRGDQFIFVNNRFITDKIISAAIIKGYEGFIMKDQRPRYTIRIDLDPREVDINVHPRKLEVRFRDMDYIFRSIQQTIRSSIEKTNLLKLDNYKYNLPDPISSRGSNYKSNIANNSDYKITNNNPLLDISQKSFQKKDYLLDNREDNYSFETKNYESIRYVQILDSYILVVKKDLVTMIDQHAAAERIAYEKLENIQKENIKIMLLPIKIELSKEQIDLLVENKNIVEALGILFETNNNYITINTIPNFLDILDLKEFIEELIDEFLNIKQSKNTKEKVKEHIRATLACHTSIRANHKLSEIEMQAIVTDLYNCKNPMNCPHGRPTIWELSKKEIEKKFKRL